MKHSSFWQRLVLSGKPSKWRIMKSLKKIMFSLATFALFTSASSAFAVEKITCQSANNALPNWTNTYYDRSVTYPRGATLINNGPISFEYRHQQSLRIKRPTATGAGIIPGVSMYWRLSTDDPTTRRAINTLPGYKRTAKVGEGTSVARGDLYLSIPNTKGTYFIYYKFITERCDVTTGVWKMIVN